MNPDIPAQVDLVVEATKFAQDVRDQRPSHSNNTNPRPRGLERWAIQGEIRADPRFIALHAISNTQFTDRLNRAVQQGRLAAMAGYSRSRQYATPEREQERLDWQEAWNKAKADVGDRIESASGRLGFEVTLNQHTQGGSVTVQVTLEDLEELVERAYPR